MEFGKAKVARLPGIHHMAFMGSVIIDVHSRTICTKHTVFVFINACSSFRFQLR